MAQASTLDDAATLLARLASKPNVQSTLILSRKDGSIIRTSGLLQQTQSAEPVAESEDTFSNGNTYVNGEREPTVSAEEIAKLTWNFVEASQGLIAGVEGQDGEEAKLIRVRGRRKEIVVVPDTNYLLVVVHETPSA